MSKLLIAGATGSIGRYVVVEAKKQGYYVRALARNPKKLSDLKEYIDDLVIGEATSPPSIQKVCEGIDFVYSSLGITKQRGKATFWDVDYQANKTLLQLALNAKVKKFVFVSIYDPKRFAGLDIVDARETFIEELVESGLDYTLIRPTGFFSDLDDLFKLAKMGRVFLIGDGQVRSNSIHGADLAKVCVDAFKGQEKEIDIGGPDIYTIEETTRLAFAALNKPARVTHVPLWAVSVIAFLVGLVSKRYGTLVRFFRAVMSKDFIAPPHGEHHAADYFAQLNAKNSAE